jgi:hypothetical protein
MSSFTDFYESRILEILAGVSAYQLPYTVVFGVFSDTDVLNLAFGTEVITSTNLAGDTEQVALERLRDAVNASGTLAYIAQVYTDETGTSILHIAQEAPYTAQAMTVTVTGTGTLLSKQVVYAALFLDDPTDAGTGTEVSGLDYHRKEVSFAAVGSGGVTTNADILFGPVGVGGWGLVTHLALFDSLVGGQALLHTSLGTSRTLLAGDELLIFAGDLTVVLD